MRGLERSQKGSGEDWIKSQRRNVQCNATQMVTRYGMNGDEGRPVSAEYPEPVCFSIPGENPERGLEERRRTDNGDLSC